MVKFIKAIKDFSGGLSEVANDNIPDNELIVAKNVVPGDGYGIARATGTVAVYTPIEGAGPVVMLAELEIDGTAHIIACTEEGGYWNMYDGVNSESGGSSTWTWTKAGDASTPTVYNFLPMKDWFVYANKLFWLDGASYKSYDGDVIADVPNTHSIDAGMWAKLQTAVAVEQRSSRWFFATADNEIIISDVGYYDKFLTTNIININSGVPDRITALHTFNDGILIFQQRSIYYLSGWDVAGGSDISLSKLTVESGTRWPKSIKTISNAVLYLGDNGLYRLSIPYYTSAIASSNVSDKKASKHLAAGIWKDVYAEVYNGVYYISLRSETAIKEYRFYLNTGSWWGEYTQQAYCYASKLYGADSLFLGAGNGYILRYDSGSYHYIATETGGVASIPIEVRTKGYDVVGATIQDSKVKRVYLVLRQYDQEQSSLEVQVKTDYTEGAWAADVSSMEEVLTAVLRDVSGDESMVWSEGEWANSYWGWIDTVTKMFQINRKCKRVQFIFRDNNTDEPLLIYAIGLQYKKKKAKGSRTGITTRQVHYDD